MSKEWRIDSLLFRSIYRVPCMSRKNECKQLPPNLASHNLTLGVSFKQLRYDSPSAPHLISHSGSTGWISASYAMKSYLYQGFSAWALLAFWIRLIRCCGNCPVHCGIFSSLPGLYPQGAVGPPPQVTTVKNVSRHYHVLWGEKSPWVGNREST